jgi:hypothetical protein
LRLEILPNHHRPTARVPKPIRLSVAVPVALDDDGTVGDGIAGLGERRVQERLSLRGQLFLAIRAVLKEIGSWQPHSTVRAAGEGAVPPILFRRNVGQAVIAPVLEETAREEIVFQRFGCLREIERRRIRIRERLLMFAPAVMPC